MIINIHEFINFYKNNKNKSNYKNNKITMGGGDSKPKPQPKVDIMDQILEIKMSSKRFKMQSKKAEKEKKKNMKLAKKVIYKDFLINFLQELKANNAEGARLYLGLAQSKAKE